MKALMEKEVIVRSDQSGVWHGTLLEQEQGEKGRDVMLRNASKIHHWEGATATSGLALYGPGDGSRICEAVELTHVAGCCEVILCAPAANKRMAEIKRWTIG